MGIDAEAGAPSTIDDAVAGAATGHGGEGGEAGARGGEQSQPEAGAPGGQSPGMADEPECRADADCSNGDPNDGEELCRDGRCGAGDAPPRVKSITPEDAADGAEPTGSIVIEFSEPVEASTVTNDAIQVFDGDDLVPGDLAYRDGEATFTPHAPLRFLETYRVTVADTIEDDAGQKLLSPFESTFTTRDGVWKTIAAVLGGVRTLSPQLPISDRGDVLLAWKGVGTASCPVSAQRFRWGAELEPATAFDPGESDCRGLTSAGNAAGTFVVLWQVAGTSSPLLSRQFRNGAWQLSSRTVTSGLAANSDSADSATNFGLGASPGGVVSVLAHAPSGGTKAWSTSAAGTWTSSTSVLSRSEDQADLSAAPSVGFDAESNALAVWRSLPHDSLPERLLAAQLSVRSGWNAATAIPGSGPTTAAPSVAVASNGDALVLWSYEGDGASLMVSHFSKLGGWASQPQQIAEYGGGGGFRGSVPVIVFDGETFVAAWSAGAGPDSPAPFPCGTDSCVYSARFDGVTGRWRTTAHSTKVELVGARPSLATDRRGNLMLIWAIAGVRGKAPLVYQRYVDGSWQEPEPLPGGEQGGAPVLGMNASGEVAAAWGELDSNRKITTVRLASFY